VLRGPQSVYYGSNASVGVINIITRKGGIGDTYSATLELGNGTTATAFLSRRMRRVMWWMIRPSSAPATNGR